MSSTPCVRSQSSMKAMKGRSTSGTTGLGTVVVSGRSRVPSPPARMRACIRPRPPRSRRGPRRSAGRRPRRSGPRRSPRRGRGSCARRRAASRACSSAIAARSSSPNSGHSVTSTTASAPSTAASAEAAKLDAPEQLARLLLGDRVVGAHLRARGLQPRGEHERGGLAHVVRVRLEREAEQRDLLAHQRPEVLLELVHDAPLLQLVDLDHRVEQLEVVARVAGELLERGDVLGEAVWRSAAGGDHRVAARHLERVDRARVALARSSPVTRTHARPRRSAGGPSGRSASPGAPSAASTPGRSRSGTRNIARSTWSAPLTRSQCVSFVDFAVRPRRHARDEPDVAEQSSHTVGQLVADRAPLEDHARPAVDERPRAVALPEAGEERPLSLERLLPGEIGDALRRRRCGRGRAAAVHQAATIRDGQRPRASLSASA